MPLGLDLGTSRFRALRRDGERLLARQVPTAYAAIEGTPAQSRLLSQARITPIHVDDACVIVGSEADYVAAALGRPLIPLLPEAQLPTSDPLARQVVAELLDSVLGPEIDGSCTVTLPRDVQPESSLHEFLLRMLQLRGVTPQIVTAAQAVAVAELGRDEFAGVVVLLSAAGASASLIEHGELQVTTEVPCGGDWLDQELARKLERCTYDAEGRRYLDLAGIARWKLSAERDLGVASDDAATALSQGYTEILSALLGRLRTAVIREGVNGPRRKRLPLICQGGGTRITGFLPLLSRLWSQVEIDLPTSAPRLARDDNWVVARGCLIHAELGAQSARSRVA